MKPDGRLILTSMLAMAAAAFLPGRLSAQRIQNTDIAFSAAPYATGRYAIPGSTVTVEGAKGYATAYRYGYQFARTSAGSFWLEMGQTFLTVGLAKASIPGSVNQNLLSFTAGLRMMMPIHARVSLFGAGAGGFGTYEYPVVNTGSITSNSTLHGVFEVGGGVDVRLVDRVSVRFELRDIITGRGGGGTMGRNHPVPLVGIALHF